MRMLNVVGRPTIDIYDGETGKYLGRGRFDLAQESVKALEDLVNYGIMPTRLVTYNMDFYQPAEDYQGIEPYTRYKRRGVLTVLFKDSVSGEEVPYEITFRYNTLVRSSPYTDRLYSGSSEYGNIEVENVRRMK